MVDPLTPRSHGTRRPGRARTAISAVAVLLASGTALTASIATDSASIRTGIALLAVAATASALRRFTGAG